MDPLTIDLMEIANLKQALREKDAELAGLRSELDKHVSAVTKLLDHIAMIAMERKGQAEEKRNAVAPEYPRCKCASCRARDTADETPHLFGSKWPNCRCQMCVDLYAKAVNVDTTSIGG